MTKLKLKLILKWLSVPIIIVSAYIIGRLGGTLIGSITGMGLIHHGIIDTYDSGFALFVSKGFTALCQLGLGLSLAMSAAYQYSPTAKEAVSFTTLGIYIGSTLTEFFINYSNKLFRS